MSTPGIAEIDRRYAELTRTAHRLERAQLEALSAVDSWPQWAATAARFPQLSPRNHLLVLGQQPAATLLLSSAQWRAVGRWPRRGSTALRLWESRPVKGRHAEVEILAPVFDLTQTDGEPVGMMPRPLPPPSGRAPRGMAAALAAAAAELGWQARHRPVPTGAAPLLDVATHSIAIDPAGDDLVHCTTVLTALTTAAASDLTDGSGQHRAAVAAAAASVVWATYDLPAPVAVRPCPQWRDDHPTLMSVLAAATGIAWQVTDTLAAHAVGTAVAEAGDAMPPPPKPAALAGLERTA